MFVLSNLKFTKVWIWQKQQPLNVLCLLYFEKDFLLCETNLGLVVFTLDQQKSDHVNWWCTIDIKIAEHLKHPSSTHPNFWVTESLFWIFIFKKTCSFSKSEWKIYWSAWCWWQWSVQVTFILLLSFHSLNQ